THRVKALTLSGSSPSPATHGLYSDLIAIAQSRGVPTFLDTYGPSLAEIWGFWPTVMQMNLREVEIYLGNPIRRPTEEDLPSLLDRCIKRGVEIPEITDVPNRSLARVQGRTFRIKPPAIEPVNPIGAGDCFLAGLVDARLLGLEPRAMLVHATACAVQNALVW